MVVLAVALVLSGCSLLPSFTGCYYRESACAPLSHDTMTQIVDALNAHDADALKEVFTQSARTQFSGELDDGVAYMLSLFPGGDVVWLDPEEEPGSGPMWNHYGQHAVWVSSSYHVTSGGNDYRLFFEGWAENEIDSNDVGVHGMGAVPWTEEGVPRISNLDAAYRSWFRSIDLGQRSDRPAFFMLDEGPSSPDRAAQIVDALNAHDAAALRGMFIDAADAVSEQIDEGLAYLLSQFPNGDVVLVQEDPGRAIISEQYDGGRTSVLLSSFYRLSSGGVDYRFYFSEFTGNGLALPGVGLYAIAVAPVGEFVNEGAEGPIYDWTSSFDAAGSGVPAIYIPEGEIR